MRRQIARFLSVILCVCMAFPASAALAPAGAAGASGGSVPLCRAGAEPVDVSVWFPDGDRTVPYVSLSLLETLCPRAGFRLEGDRLTSSLTEGYVEFDVEGQTLRQSRFALDPGEEDDYPMRHTVSVTASSGKDAVIDLSESGYRLIRRDGELLLPATVVSALFLEPLYQILCYDGERLYAFSYSAMLGEGEEGDAFFEDVEPLLQNGPWSEWDPTLRQTNYDALCFRFDWAYGMRQRWEGGMDRFLSEKYAWLKDGLLNESGAAYIHMVDLLFELVIDDIHTGALDYPPYALRMTEEELEDAYWNLEGVSDEELDAVDTTRCALWLAKEDEYTALREECLPDTGDQSLRYYRDMAVLTMDSFEFDEEYWQSYEYGSPVTAEDTFGFLYRAFEEIEEEHPEVTSVVFDLTVNEGGNSYGVDAVLGFLKQTFTTEWDYGLTGVTVSTAYRMDTNLDGVTDERDSMEGKYRFVILQSEVSFSGANQLACFAKAQGAAVIAGERSGGGAYSVSPALDAYGMGYVYSGMTGYGISSARGEDVCVTPDISVPSSAWYHDEALYAALFENPDVTPDQTDAYTVTVENGTLENGASSGVFRKGETVSIRAGAEDGAFVRWIWSPAAPLEFVSGGETTPDASFRMPENDLALSASFAAKKQGCYIATAVYGSYDCPEVWTLRRFRDNVLSRTWHGRLFIRIYYALSPAAVRLFGNMTCFQDFWRAVLDRMVSKLQQEGFASTPYQDR